MRPFRLTWPYFFGFISYVPIKLRVLKFKMRRNNYWPQRSCGQGYVFTRVCDSVNRGSLPQCMLGYHTPPQEQTPPRSRPPGSRHPSREQTPLGSRHPLRSRPPREQTAPPPRADTPGSRLRHTVNERPVRILLECILAQIQWKHVQWKVANFRKLAFHFYSPHHAAQRDS